MYLKLFPCFQLIMSLLNPKAPYMQYIFHYFYSCTFITVILNQSTTHFNYISYFFVFVYSPTELQLYKL